MEASKTALRNMLRTLNYTIIAEEGDVWTLCDNRDSARRTVIEVTPRRRGRKAEYRIIERTCERG